MKTLLTIFTLSVLSTILFSQEGSSNPNKKQFDEPASSAKLTFKKDNTKLKINEEKTLQKMNLNSPVTDRFELTDLVWPQNPGDADVCLWNDDKIGVATMTIDDNIESDFSWWLSMQSKYGIHFTWFTILNNVSSWDKYQVLIDSGNEVQGHDDCNINDFTDSAYSAALENTKSVINTNLTNNLCSTYAYPCGTADKSSIARNTFISLRGVLGWMNFANKIDYLNVNSRSSTNDTHDIDVLLDKNEKLWNMSFYRGWLCYHYHSIGSIKEQTEYFLRYLSSHSNKIWIGKYSEVAKYGQERDSHTIGVDEFNDTILKFTLSDEMDDYYFDYPLTVKVCVNPFWNEVTATQNGETIESSFLSYEGKKYILVKAIPDRGQVKLSGKITHAPIQDEIEDQKLEEGSSITLDLTAFDYDNDPISFSVKNLPPFASLFDKGDGTAQILINPSLGDKGFYENITIITSDSSGSNSVTFSITVMESGTSGVSVYYCDPVNGSMENDGSESNPWSKLEDVFSTGKTFMSGDIIYLKTGAHGEPEITGNNSDYVTIAAAPSESPVIASVTLNNGSFWAFDGLSISSDGNGGTSTRFYLFSSEKSMSHIKIENCKFYSAENSGDWTTSEWLANTKDAILIKGEYSILRNNLITNNNQSLEIQGDFVEVSNNKIDNFSADAIRAFSSHAIYTGNTIRDAYVEGANHDDAFQMYDAENISTGLVEDVVIRNNRIFTFLDPISQDMIDDNRIGYNMQGIILTDGNCKNIIIENNLIISDHWHGITLPAAVNCRIQNNTVLKTPSSVNPDTTVLPWISYGENKQNIKSSYSAIRNNIATKLSSWAYGDYIGIIDENNLVVSTDQYNQYFVDPQHSNYHLKEGSPAIDIGTESEIYLFDLDGNPRPYNDITDCGAYEYQGYEIMNNPPAIDSVSDQEMQAGTILELKIAVNNNENDAITIWIDNLPDFGNFTVNTDDTIRINFQPTSSDTGVYRNITISATDNIDTSSIQFSLSVNGQTSIKNSAISQNIIFYPNPLNDGAFNIKINSISSESPIKIELLNSSGCIVFSRTYSKDKTFIHINEFEKLISGMYFIRMGFSNQIIHKKIIKQSSGL